ncbi:MAG: helix-turn-helix transcriptional regulator [Clostridia bacterium]|nr:helix-turn-helix transcriptional regulator [Clostridia bacterium]
MIGINFDLPVTYKHASLRFFKKDERHVTRTCYDNVLLLVYEGVLRFSENGVQREVRAGEYFIQRKNSHHSGEIVSDAPKYLYVHFDGEWTEERDALPYSGKFSYDSLSELIQRIDRAAHQFTPYNELQYLFLKLLMKLKEKHRRNDIAEIFFDYINDNLHNIHSLSDICKEFNYSKNYVIRIFNREFGVSPIQFINEMRIKRALYILETTSKPIKEIMEECGFVDYPYFYKRFVKKTGISPQKWRERMRTNPIGC